MFTHLHGHSSFSFLEAIGKPNKIAARVKELGMNAIAITDYNGLYGAIKFLQYAKDEGIKPILGVELGFVLDLAVTTPTEHMGNIVLLAESHDGYQHLLELISFANTKGIHGKPKLDLSALQAYAGGVVAFWGGKKSWFGKMILHDESPEKIKEIIGLIVWALGKDQVFFEIIAQDESQDPQLRKVNEAAAQYAQEMSIPCLVNSNYHYPKKDDREAWEVALAIKDGKRIFDEDRRAPVGQFHIMSEEEIRAVLAGNGYAEERIQILIDENSTLAERIQTKVSLGQILFPNYSTPEDILALYEENKEGLVL